MIGGESSQRFPGDPHSKTFYTCSGGVFHRFRRHMSFAMMDEKRKLSNCQLSGSANLPFLESVTVDLDLVKKHLEYSCRQVAVRGPCLWVLKSWLIGLKGLRITD